MADAPRDPAERRASQEATLNFVNGDEIKRFVESFAERVQRAPAKQWFRSNLRNRLLNDTRFAHVVTCDEILRLLGAEDVEDLPAWVRKALAEKKPLHWFEPSTPWEDGADMVQTMYHVVDWFEALPDDDRRWRQPQRISVEDAVAAARAWHEHLAKRVADAWPEDWAGVVSVMRFEEGLCIVRLQSGAALNREGRMMGHCVGTYARKVVAGTSEIFSLRDDLNRPHATMEVVGGRVVQIRGRANSSLAHKWRRHVAKFVRSMDWSASDWAGLPVFEGRIYADADDVMADLEKSAPMREAMFDGARLVPIVRLVQSIEPTPTGLAKKRQAALLDMLSAAAIACGGYRLTQANEAAVDLPGKTIAEFKIEIAGAAFTLAELGYLGEVLPGVIALCRQVGQNVLALLNAQPAALYRLSVGRGLTTRRNALVRFFASAGLAEEFHGVRMATLEYKRERVAEGLLALRRRLADRRTLAQISETDRAKALNTMRVQAPHFCEQTLCDPNVA